MRRHAVVLLVCVWLCAGCSSDPVPLPPVPPPADPLAVAVQEQQRELAAMMRRVETAYRDALRPLVGDAPVQCNADPSRSRSLRVWDASPEQLAQWFRCLQDARARGATAVIALEHAVTDGRYVTGAVASRDGLVRAFRYSQNCCGGPRGRLDAGPCEAPTPERRHPEEYGIRCRNADARGRVPTPELWSRESILPAELSARLQALAGDRARDCGFELTEGSNPYFRRPDQIATALACMRIATASGRAAWMLIPIERARALTVHALVRQPSGSDIEIRFAATLSGGDIGPATIEERDCSHARIVAARDGGGDFVCASAPTPPAPPSPRRPGP